MKTRPIDANQLYRIEKLLDTDIVKKDKVASELLEQVLYDIQHMPTLTPPNEWVRVEERPPKAEKEVRLFCITPNGYKYQCQGFYVPPGTLRDDSGYSWDWECCDQYDEDTGDYFVNPGWYESGHNWDEYSAFEIADKVTHWGPLSAPPGEDNNVPTNKPLTLEQLREMDREPVYIPEIECWALVKREQTTLLFTFSDGKQCPASEWYEQVGPVYRRPPEGEE